MTIIDKGPGFELHTVTDAPTLSRHGIVAGKAYRLIVKWGHPADTICYLCERSDYGVADDDERASHVRYASMTLSPQGDYPFFTVPVGFLRAEP